MKEFTQPKPKPFGQAEPKLTMGDDGAGSPLEAIYRGIVFSAKDFFTNQMDEFRYATTVGFDDEGYKDSKEKWGWTDEDVHAMKELQEKFIELQIKTCR